MVKFLKGLFESSKLSRNTTPKLVSVIFAIVLYMFVMGEVNPEEERPLNNLKVELLNKEELENSGLVFIDQNEFTVNVKIAGKKNELPKISPDDIKVSADLSNAKEGENIIILKVSNPVNVEIKEMAPQQINVRLDKIVQGQKNVEVIPKGSPVRNYVVGKYRTTPDSVLIEGPKSRVNLVAKVVAEIDVEGIKDNIRKDVPIKAVDSQGEDVIGVDVKTNNVNVYLSMLKLKNVPIKPNIQGAVREGYKITKVEVTPENITLRGEENKIDGISEIFTKNISVEELDTALVTQVNLDLPKDLEAPYLQDLPEIYVGVEKIETKEFTFKGSEISANNLKNTLTTNIGELNQDIKVKISDVRSVLEKVNRNDLELIIDAEGLDVGTYTFKLNLNKNGSYEDIEILPQEIKIQLLNKEDLEVTNETIDEDTNEVNN
ncbi:MAG: CdaR family protein [Clostridia bacterium]|nr:CdaR family protein [Clostridia bacterium]